MQRRMARIALGRLDSSVIPYGVDATAFAPDPGARAALGLAPGEPVVLSVGSMYSPEDDRKGFAVLIDAFERVVRRSVPGARLVIVGKTFGLAEAGGVSVLDGVGRDDLRRWYAAASVFTLPSLGDHAPLAVLEAMAAGSPVVATRVGGIPEEVEADATGLLVPPRDAPALGAALTRLLKDRDLARAMGAAGRRRALERFGRGRAWAAHADLYRRLAGRDPGPR
jgi:glycosyltransferase involved in cell wall biosynthesis